MLDNNGRKSSFREKSRGNRRLINGGIFLISSKCLSLVAGDQVSWESEPLEKLASISDRIDSRHDGFWQSIDTLRKKNTLEKIW